MRPLSCCIYPASLLQPKPNCCNREGEADAYRRKRLPASTLPAMLAQQIGERTDGNPLFVVNTVEYLLQRELLTAHAGQWRLTRALSAHEVPETLQYLIGKQLDDLP